MRPLILIVPVLCCVSLFAQSRHYGNSQYGYSVKIPSRFPILTNNAPQPNHGFELNLDKNQTITVYATFNTTEEPNTEEALLEWMQLNFNHTFKPFSSGVVTIAGLNGNRTIGTIQTEQGEKLIDYIKVERRVKGKPTDTLIQYYLFLNSNNNNYPKSSLLFSNIISNFTLQPIR